MDEIHRPEQPTARQGPSPAYLVVAIILAVALAGGGFLVGRASVSPPAQTSDRAGSTCDDATAAADEQLEVAEEASVDAATIPGEADRQHAALKQAAVVIGQNPSCFSAAERATAQTFLDNDEQEALRSAAQCAAAQDVMERSLYC
ncbi:hypothetical protein AB0I00_40805 [Streptomyces sp. NPDC050803]|uniref:hypothetical protein n=1 Tax=unclassified Streptomyces TaxID=2593676 RepID=UPI0034397A50